MITTRRPEIFLSSEAYNHKLPSPAEMANFDQSAMAAGCSAKTLMEQAGKAIYQAIAPRLRANRKPILILCGPGNNGGDGLVVARHACFDGLNVTIALLAPIKVGSLSAQMLSELPKNRFVQIDASNEQGVEQLRAYFKNQCFVLDALLGTGQAEAPRAMIAKALELCREYDRIGNDAQSERIAIDIPSGMNAASGEVYENCFRADLTVSVELIKRGMLQYPARRFCGDIVTVSAGIDCSNQACEFNLINSDVLRLLPARQPNAHKGDLGSVLVVAGSKAMPGAAALTSRSALRSGAGRVYRMVNHTWPTDVSTPEIIFKYTNSESQYFTSKDMDSCSDYLRSANSLALGPGLGDSSSTQKFACDVLAHAKIPTVVDADGLNALAQQRKSVAWNDLKNCVLTPHSAEAARLLESSSEEINKDRFKAAAQLAKLTSAVIVLKGAGTIVYAGKQGWLCERGTPFLATAGSGDVLTGIIAALLAQGLSTLHAALLGVYAHATAGELAVSRVQGPIIASDIIEALPTILGDRVAWR